MAEHWLKQPKMLPSSHVAGECHKQFRYIDHHKTLAYKPFLLGIGMSLDQIKYDYPCLYWLLL